MKNPFKFSNDYLKRSQQTSVEERLDFINNYQLAQANQEIPSTSINFDVPECLIDAFKFKSKLSGTDYQTQIRKLMKQWLDTGS